VAASPAVVEQVLAGWEVDLAKLADLVHDAEGRATEFWLAGWKLLPEARVARELAGRYGRARHADGRSAARARSRSSTS
jgi:hypothetical protein